MRRSELRESVRQVGVALREPEEFALRWHREGQPYPLAVWGALGCTAVLGTTVYGMTMGMLGGSGLEVLRSAVLLTVAAGLAWVIPLQSQRTRRPDCGRRRGHLAGHVAGRGGTKGCCVWD